VRAQTGYRGVVWSQNTRRQGGVLGRAYDS